MGFRTRSVLLALLSMACGSPSEPPRDSVGGSGGVQNSSGSSAGGAGGSVQAGSGGTGSGGLSAGGTDVGGAPAAGAPATESLRFACREYVQAICERFDACGSTDFDTCMIGQRSCPDRLFSEGSSFTREAALSCAEEWRALPCDQVIADVPPSCAEIPGTFSDGATCSYSTQCASGACSDSCGSCLPVVEADSACAPNVACPRGQACVNDTCTDAPRDYDPDKLPGAVCSGFCVSGYLCARTAPEAEPSCLPIPAPGEPCLYKQVEEVDSTPGACGVDAYCAADFSCVADPGSGDPCAPAGLGIPRCPADHECVGEICQSEANPGTSCEVGGSSCLADTSCLCADAGCSSRKCLFPVEEGLPCDSADQGCVDETVCQDGKCVATDALTDFAACE
jgi:hypothetical protein